ncbi:hypothetical protein Tsubulata_044666 [Turnera subulata]|uniref:Uncharacterized protein n=1 Tax=Turnera subulata TaxID=218843 RepID=A0A9Q0G121_9ROSI|nr:hypothetical protein Tsubulata_044666 [Turnera subulata]
MPFPMKIQPIDVDSRSPLPIPARPEPAKPVLKSRLKRLFDRQFRISSVEKPPITGGEAPQYGTKDGGGGEFEPSSVCLAKMVQSYMEESNDKPFRGRHRCNCFNGNSNDSSDDEFDVFGGGSGGGFGDSLIGNGSFSDACDALKSLTPCASVVERNLLADTAMIVDKHKNNHRQKDDLRKILTDGLSSLGYNSSICKSKWDKSPSYPAGEYEYIDVITEGGERVLVDIDFRSEFEIARSTGTYKAILQSLPYIFVGKPDRLGQMVSIVAEAAKQSLKKKGMPVPPWRKPEYMRAKWLSPNFTRVNDAAEKRTAADDDDDGRGSVAAAESDDCGGELELIFGEKATSSETEQSSSSSSSSESSSSSPSAEVESEAKVVEPATWQPPAVKPKGGVKMVTGLASLLKEKP